MVETMVFNKDTINCTVFNELAQEADYRENAYMWRQNSDALLGAFSHYISQFRSDKYVLKEPLKVEVSSYQGGFLALDSDVDRHGVGGTLTEALYDYEEVLLGYLESLNKHYPKISTKLKDDLDFLNRKISRVE